MPSIIRGIFYRHLWHGKHGDAEIARDVAKKLIEAQTGTRLPTIAESFDYPVIVAT